MKKISFIILGFAFVSATQAQELYPTANEKGKWGYVDTDGNRVIKYKYDEANPFVNGVAVVKDDEYYGFINEKGKEIGKGISYSVIDEYAGTNLYLVAHKGDYAKKAEKIKSRRDIDIRNFKGSTTRQIGKAAWGLMDRTGNYVLKAEYDELSSLHGDIAYIIKGGKWGLISSGGSVIVKPKDYTFISDFTDQGLAFVQKGKKYGVINKEGRVIIEPKYEEIFFYYADKENPENVPSISLNGRGLNSKGADMIRCTKLTVPVHATPYIMYGNKYLKKGATMVLCDNHGARIVPEKLMANMRSPKDGMVIGQKWDKKKKNMKSCFYDINRQRLIDISNDAEYGDFKEGHSLAIEKKSSPTQRDWIYYFVDKEGNSCSERFNFVGSESEGYYVVRKEGKTGILDSLLNEKVECKYSGGGEKVSEGLLNVMRAGLWGYVNTEGQEVIPLDYDASTEPFIHGHAFVSNMVNGERRFGLINHQNQIVVPIAYQKISYMPNKQRQLHGAWVSTDGNVYSRYSLSSGRITLENAFNSIQYADDASSIVKNAENLWGNIDFEGNLRIPCQMNTAEQVKKALESMSEHGQQTMTEAEAYRFNLYTGTKSDSHAIAEKIPENEWDF